MNQEDFDLLAGLAIVGSDSRPINPALLTPNERLEAVSAAVKEAQIFPNCCICFEEVPDNELFVLPCEHGGCDSCMLQLLSCPLLENQTTKKCPVCRSDIDPDFLSLGDVVEEFTGLGITPPRRSSRGRARRCLTATAQPTRRNRRVLVREQETTAAAQVVGEEVAVSQTSANSTIIEGQDEVVIQPQQTLVSPLARRYRLRNSTIQEGRGSGLDNLQDLYETLERDVLPLLKLIRNKMPQCFITDDNNVMFEPCCGNGAISNVFKLLGYKVIERDFYTKVPSHDFLTNEFPEDRFDFIVTNPPYNGKKKFFARALESGKPFALFLPIDTLFLVGVDAMLQGHKVLILSPPKSPMFLRNGEYKRVANGVVWFMVDFPFLAEGITYQYYSYDN